MLLFSIFYYLSVFYNLIISLSPFSYPTLIKILLYFSFLYSLPLMTILSFLLFQSSCFFIFFFLCLCSFSLIFKTLLPFMFLFLYGSLPFMKFSALSFFAYFRLFSFQFLILNLTEAFNLTNQAFRKVLPCSRRQPTAVKLSSFFCRT